MIAFPNAKINIGLTVTGRRKDGYHDLESVFFPVSLRDVLEVVDNHSSLGTVFTSSGLAINASADSNLCVKAYELLKNDFPSLPPFLIHLHKNIPVGAGLGGGSSDGAGMLQLLNKKYQLGLSEVEFRDYALQLGSDCPFFILNKPCFVAGRGEHLEEIILDLTGYKIILINPGIKISTAWAFSRIREFGKPGLLREAIHLPVESWRGSVVNDFEAAIFPEFPVLGDIKETLYRHGAAYASMTGSGSTILGLFRTSDKPEFRFPPEYFQSWV